MVNDGKVVGSKGVKAPEFSMHRKFSWYEYTPHEAMVVVVVTSALNIPYYLYYRPNGIFD